MATTKKPACPKPNIKALLQLAEEGELRNRNIRDDLLLLSGQFEEVQCKETIGILDDDDSANQWV